MEIKTLNKYKKWFRSKGYEFTDEFWMEDYIADHKFIDIIKLIDNYVSEQAKSQERYKANLNIGCVRLSLPLKDNYQYLRGLEEGYGIQEPIDSDDFPEEFENINDVMERIWDIENNEA